MSTCPRVIITITNDKTKESRKVTVEGKPTFVFSANFNILKTPEERLNTTYGSFVFNHWLDLDTTEEHLQHDHEDFITDEIDPHDVIPKVCEEELYCPPQVLQIFGVFLPLKILIERDWFTPYELPVEEDE